MQIRDGFGVEFVDRRNGPHESSHLSPDSREIRERTEAPIINEARTAMPAVAYPGHFLPRRTVALRKTPASARSEGVAEMAIWVHHEMAVVGHHSGEFSIPHDTPAMQPNRPIA